MESRAMRTEEEIEQAMRRHGSAVYVVALAQTRSREAARPFELARFPAAREADGQADGGGDDPAQA